MATATDESVQQRAFELYLKRDGSHGSDQDDWFKAEKEVHEQGNVRTKTVKRSGTKTGQRM